MKEKQGDLKREIGVFGLSANIVNIIVGAGIFALPAFVAAGLGSASIFAYLFCGILITLVMLCFAEAGSRLTSGGGAYQYINTAEIPVQVVTVPSMYTLSTELCIIIELFLWRCRLGQL